MTGYGPRTSSRRLLLGGAAVVLVVVALAVIAVVWLLRGRDEATSSITEKSPSLAVDRFLAAWNDDDDVAARACPATRSLVLFSSDQNRAVVRSLRRVGPVPSTPTGARRSVAVAQVAGCAKSDGATYPTTVTASGSGTRWCISSMGGPVRLQR